MQQVQKVPKKGSQKIPQLRHIKSHMGHIKVPAEDCTNTFRLSEKN